jgi:AcrR family transcriptional regulator
MGRTKASDLERDLSVEKAEQILKGAMQEFLANGYAATSMDRVAATAGVSKATVYSHFQDKEGLFTVLVQRMAQKKLSVIYGGAQVPKGDVSVVLRQLATTALQQCRDDRENLAFTRLIIGESGRFPELAKIFVENMTKQGIKTLGQYLSAHPELNIPDPEAIARILIGSIVYFTLTQEMLYGKDIIPMEGDRLIDSLMHLVRSSMQCGNTAKLSETTVAIAPVQW